MIVPTYTSTAKNVTGVAGQQFGFKIPAGALSQGQVAQAQLASKVSDTAASWGSAFYGMHRSAVIGKQVAAATKDLDDAQLKAGKQDPLAGTPDKTPGGYLAAQLPSILAKATGGTIDPWTKAAISARVSAQFQTRRREVNKATRIRIVQYEQGRVADRVDWLRDQVARTVPEDWDGTIDNLTADGQEHYDELDKMRTNAAEQGIITFKQARDGAKADRSYIGKLALSKRMTAATTSAESTMLLEKLRDGKSFRLLTGKDRDVVELRLHRQIVRQQSAENTAARQQEIARHKDKKRTRETNEGALLKAIYDYRFNNGKLPSVNAVQKMELDPSARRSIMAMLLDETPDDTDPDYWQELADALLEIEESADAPDVVSENLNALQKQLHKEVAKGQASRINHSDVAAFISQIGDIRNGQGRGKALNNVYSTLRATLKQDPNGKLVDGRDAVRFFAARRKARRVLYKEGGTEEDALEAGLTILEKARGLYVYHPPALPLPQAFGVPVETRKWTLDDYDKVRGWVETNPQHFTRPEERDQTLKELDDIADAIHERLRKAEMRK